MVRVTMYKNYACISTCMLLNAAIFFYTSDTPSDRQAPLIAKITMLTWVAIVPAVITALSASGKKQASPLIILCCLLTTLSGILFTYLYATSSDPSRVIVLAPHFALTYVFSFVSLFALRSKSLKRPFRRSFVQDPDADRQIATIIKMHGHGSSATGIASSLNSNQEKYILDNSEWTKEKVEAVIKTFVRKPKPPS